MTDHPDVNALRAYAAGALSPRETRAVDTHVATCATCKAALAECQGAASTAHMLRRIERAGGHLPYEDLSALVDGKMARERMPAIDRHLSACGRCRRELDDMRAFAPALSRPLAVPASPKTGWLEGLRGWFAAAPAMRGSAAAVVAALAAALVLSGRIGPSGPVDSSGGASTTAASVGDGSRSGPGHPIAHDAQGALDRQVFDRLDRFAPDAVEPYRANDFTRVAALLKVRADKGDVSATQAYGLLLAEGRGVAEDRTAAVRLLRIAAAANDPGAAHNLQILRGGSTKGSYSR